MKIVVRDERSGKCEELAGKNVESESKFEKREKRGLKKTK
jgi:hypothetical protein